MTSVLSAERHADAEAGAGSPAARVPAVVGFVAVVALVALSWSQGAVTLPFPPHAHHGVLHLVWFVALAVLALAWLRLLRFAADGRITQRAARLVGLAWAVPLLAAAPMCSRDAYAYAAQGNLLVHGFNPYRVGPAAIHDDFLRQVSPIWRHSTTPYGQVWVEISRAAAALTGEHPLRTALLFRGVVFVSLLAIAACLPRLTDTLGGRRAQTTVLFLLNPFTLVVGLGGAHNDIVMLALAVGALWLVVRSQTWWALAAAGALCVVAASVKLPGVLFLPFVPLVWLRLRRSGSFVAAGSVVLAAAGATAGIITAITRLPQGWRPSLDAGTSSLSVLSIPLQGVLMKRYVSGPRYGKLTHVSPHTLHSLRPVALGLTAVALLACWLLALRGRPVSWLAAGLAVSVVLSTAIQSWYFLWAFVLVACLPWRRRTLLLAAGASVAFTVCLAPDGAQITDKVVSIPIALLCLAASALMLWPRLRLRLPARATAV